MNSFFLLINSDLAVLSRSVLMIVWGVSVLSRGFTAWCEISHLVLRETLQPLGAQRGVSILPPPAAFVQCFPYFVCLLLSVNSCVRSDWETQLLSKATPSGAAVRLPVWFSSRTNRFPQQRPDSSALKHHLSTRAELPCCDKTMGNWAQLPPSGQTCVTAAVTCLQRIASILWSCIGESG